MLCKSTTQALRKIKKYSYKEGGGYGQTPSVCFKSSALIRAEQCRGSRYQLAISYIDPRISKPTPHPNYNYNIRELNSNSNELLVVCHIFGLSLSANFQISTWITGYPKQCNKFDVECIAINSGTNTQRSKVTHYGVILLRINFLICIFFL